ncbi:MAG: TetR/AcrR family transcriptional regulator [bacterium]
MARRNTRKLILEASLLLFNEEGLSRVSTNHIADEVDISPGNLYYHFKNKEDIVSQLFEELNQKLSPLLDHSDQQNLTAEDMWLYIHLIFEAIWSYRFFYRSLADVNEMNSMLARKFKRLILKKKSAALNICLNLKKNNALELPDEEVAILANNITVILCFWFYYKTQLEPSNEQDLLIDGVRQVLLTVAGLLNPDEAQRLRYLAKQYI